MAMYSVKVSGSGMVGVIGSGNKSWSRLTPCALEEVETGMDVEDGLQRTMSGSSK